MGAWGEVEARAAIQRGGGNVSVQVLPYFFASLIGRGQLPPILELATFESTSADE